jgi:hypothetical protein
VKGKKARKEKSRERNKRNANKKGRSQIIPICKKFGSISKRP